MTIFDILLAQCTEQLFSHSYVDLYILTWIWFHFPSFHFLYDNFSLFDYLYGFISRTKPLMNLDQQLIEIEQVPRVINVIILQSPPCHENHITTHHDHKPQLLMIWCDVLCSPGFRLQVWARRVPGLGAGAGGGHGAHRGAPRPLRILNTGGETWNKSCVNIRHNNLTLVYTFTHFRKNERTVMCKY